MKHRRLVPFVLAPCLLGSSSARALTITSQTESSPFPGVRLVELRTSNPTTRAWATYVDLCTEHVHVDATSTPSSLRSAGAWAGSVGAQIATNGDFYRTAPIRVYGQAVGDGTAWPDIQTGTDSAYASEWYYQDYGWIAFGPDWVDFTHTGYVKKHAADFGIQEGFRPHEVTHAVPRGTLALVSGFPALVVEGQRITCSSPTDPSCFPDRSDMRDRHPRTAMGLSQDRRTFLLVVVDGRTSVSAGMYGTELAELMDKLGAWQAFNLDGGGSTQMWVEGQSYVNSATGNNGGSVRSVANHWGVFAGTEGGKSRKPGHCLDYLNGAVLQSAMQQSRGTTDYDGDGHADACIRGEDGFTCSRGEAGALGAAASFVGLDDDSGWSDLSNYGTLRMGDVDGDGKADLCARANARVLCWVTVSEPFDTRIEGPSLSDDGGWDRPQYFSTLRLADVDGDGRDDLCARAASGLRCYLSTGDGFGDPVQTDRFADTDGFGAADKYGSLRMGDVNGDGLADACARDADGVDCYLSDGAGFPSHVVGPAWADAQGWWRPMYFSTIQLVDVDGDGRADLCARTSSDYRCHLSVGDTFSDPVVKGILKNENGWDDPSNYGTIRLADIDADGDADLCARYDAMVRCWPWEAGGFGTRFDGPALSDDGGWKLDRQYGSLRLADVTGDRRADLCGLDDGGLFCFPSQGTGFGDRIDGPSWSGLGWMHPSVYGSLLLSGPVCRPSPEVCNGVDDDCDFEVDEGCGVDGGPGGVGGAGGSDGGAPDTGTETDAGSAEDASAGGASGTGGTWYDEEAEGGCGCGVPAKPGGAAGVLLIALAWLWRRRLANHN